MNSSKKKREWPEHISWWDRNEKKVNIILWIIFFSLLMVVRPLFSLGIVNTEIAIIWGSLFILDLTLLSFLTRGVEHHRG